MKASLVWTLSSVAAIGLVGTGVAVWALTQPQPTTASTDDGPADGIVVDAAEVPPLYTGDELEWLIPADDVLGALAGASGFEQTEAAYGGTGETEGIGANPEQCTMLVQEDFTDVVGQRFRRFSTESGYGSVRVLQFGSPETAEAWITPHLDAAGDASCAAFEWGRFYGDEDEVFQHYTHALLADDTAAAGGADAQVVIERLDVAESGEYDQDLITATMIYGNTITMLSVGFRDDTAVEADAVVNALRAQADEAHENLVAALR